MTTTTTTVPSGRATSGPTVASTGITMINTVLNTYAKNPWKLWMILQAGGFTAWIILVTMIVWVINHVLASFIENTLGLSVQAIRGAIFLTCGLSIVSSHMLWREMIRKYNAVHLKAYVKHGKHSELFVNDKEALAAREQRLTQKAEARRLKNNNSRNGSRKRTGQAEVEIIDANVNVEAETIM